MILCTFTGTLKIGQEKKATQDWVTGQPHPTLDFCGKLDTRRRYIWTAGKSALELSIASKLDASVWTTGKADVQGKIMHAKVSPTDKVLTDKLGLSDKTAFENSIANKLDTSVWNTRKAALEASIATKADRNDRRFTTFGAVRFLEVLFIR